MSTFKPLWGNRHGLDSKEKTEGSMYFCKDDLSLHVDYVDDNGELKRSQVSSCGEHTHEISDINGLQRRLDELTPPPDIETSDDVIIKINQLSLAMNDMINTINNLSHTVNLLTPSVGEIYMTTLNENPSVKFGGTWEQIKDVFLLSAGDKYVAGSIGGEAEHVLTIDEIPSHSHTFNRHQLWRTEEVPEAGTSDGYGASNKTLSVYVDNTSMTGGNQAHNNMPPYLVVYVWKRVA